MAYTDDQVGLHDSTITKITQSDGSVALHLEYVTFGEELYSAIATITAIETILRDGVTLEQFQMETEDGEILRLELERDQITLTVTWYKYQPRSWDINVYQLLGKRIGLKVDRLAPSEP